MALCHNLGPDQHIVAPLGHASGQLGRSPRSGQQIADHQRRPRCRKACRHFFEQALDTRAARHQCSCREAFRTAGGNRFGMAAMVAEKPPGKPVLDQPGGTARALKAVAAGAAQG